MPIYKVPINAKTEIMKNISLINLFDLLVDSIWRSLRNKGRLPGLVKVFSLTLFLVIFTSQLFAQQIYINEFMASNSSTIADGVDYDDWVELYNAGTSPVDIGGMYLSDNLAEPTLSQVPTTDPASTTIPAGGFLLLWFDKEPLQGPLHVNAKLGSGGEDVVLTAADGVTTIDSYTFGPQISDISEGRVGDGNPTWDFFAVPTPNATNDSPPGAPMVDRPVADIAGGNFTSAVTVTLSGPGTIYYTLDGREPTETDTEYTAPLTISTNTPLRARAFDAPALPSPVMTHTYLFNVSHTFPILTYTADPDEMFDPVIGIYPNYLEDIEIKANAELWEPDGSLAFNMLFESEVQGTGSASLPQKPLALKAKASVGGATIPYQVFPDLPYTEYRSLTLRNSGQDWNITMFRDALAASLVATVDDVGTIIRTPDVFMQGYRPGVMYLNGDYYGIHNIRERIDKRYLKVHFNLDDNEVDFLENKSEVKEGDLVEWDIFETFLENNNLSSDANYQYVKDNMDVTHYADYIAFNLYIDSQDWPGNNNRRWRKRTAGEKWRWISWDLDFSFGLFVPGQPYNSGDFNYNTLGRLMDLGGYNWPTPDWSTLLFRRLIENDEWRTDFINRMADQLNVLYTPARINNRIDDFVTTYTPEIQAHFDEWAAGYQTWDEDVQKLRDFANGRAGVMRNHMVSEFSDVTGVSPVTINLSPADKGEVDLSTITVREVDNGWTGDYFRGVDIPVMAFPNRGYIVNWSDALSGNDSKESINLNSSATITANFILGSTATDPIVINEINYNSPDGLESGDWVELYNPNSSAVNIEGWYFEDESGKFFGIPGGTSIPAGGYLLLIEDETQFNAVYPGVNGYVGEFGLDPRGFGLSGGGELITLKNANGTLIDEVDYDDNAPWPTEADGDGPTLQLTSPDLDNALASSWQALPSTPGALNGTNTGQNQMITFPAIGDKLTTDAPFSISATATSGLTVDFAILSGPATVSGNTITLTGAEGTVTVQATQDGDSNWNPAPPVNQSFNVTDPSTGPCNVTYTTTNSSITVSGLDAAHVILKLFDPVWATAFQCNDNCSNPQTISGLGAGVHHLDVQLYDASWQPICTVLEDINIGGGCIDNDGDGVCAPVDCDDNDPTLPATVGTSCDDGDPNTENDVILADGCTCEGTPVGCTDNDGDGFCDFEDCDDNDSSVPTTVGTSCDDGDPNTENDVIQADGCTCAGTPITGDPCDNVTITPGPNSITVTGLNTPITQVQILDSGWSTVFNCSGNCGTTETANNLPEDTYYVKVRLYNASWDFLCKVIEFVDVTDGGGCTDNDNDGVCAPQDCDDNDASIPTTPGTTCDDGDPNTENDAIQADGCTCAGTPIGGGTDVGCGVSYTSTSTSVTITGLTAPHVIMKLFAPNWTTVYDCFDDCPDPLTITGLTDGTYHLSVDLYESNWSPTCDLLEDVIVGTGSPLESEALDVLFFNAMKNGPKVRLNWVTNMSGQTDAFIIERSLDGVQFDMLEELSSYGESETEMLYQTEDSNPKFGANFYRLKQVLNDGSIVYSDLKKVSFHLDLSEVLIFPNPTSNDLYINLNAFEGRSAQVAIYNQLGEQLMMEEIETLTTEALRFDVNSYNSGMYFITIKIDDQPRKSFRFVKGKL